MHTATYTSRRGELEHYFDRTAAETWARLTSDEPVSRIRATVRAGRDRMRETLLDWLPADLSGHRVLDAGCGTGALAFELARRGAKVLGIDLSPTLIGLARSRIPPSLGSRLELRVGDMLDPALGCFDYVVAMDSLIHYIGDDIARTLGTLAQRTGSGLLFTYAPRTPALALMHALGRLFPRSDRAPAIEPIGAGRLLRLLRAQADLANWQPGRSLRVDVGFYKSQALELTRTWSR